MNELKIRDPAITEEVSGAVELEIGHVSNGEDGPISFVFPNFSNISQITLSSTFPEAPAVDEELVVTKGKTPVNFPHRMYDPAVTADSAKDRAIAQTEVISLFKRMLGYVLSNEEYIGIKNFLDMASAWGQGIEVGSVSLYVGFVMLQKYFKSIPMEFGNNLVLRKADLELPRVVYKYTMATMGWRGLSFFGKGQGIIADSLRSQADLRAVLNFLNMNKSDLLIFELGESRIFRPNFFVAIDRGLSAVILSIRGTMSLSDSITDFACEYVKYRDGMVHSGFFEAARWFMENICHQLLIFAREYDLENVFITGHSLGGSASTLTTVLLVDELRKEGVTWPKTAAGKPINIHCYAYGAAPTVTRNLCDDYSEFIDIFIYGDDIVPRMSYGSLIDFQILMVFAAEVGSASYVFKNNLSEELFKKIRDCHVAMKSQTPPMNLKLYIPGRIHHMMKFKAPSNNRYTIIDTCTSDRFFEAHVTRKMLNHHMPPKYEKALDDAYLVLLQEELEMSNNPPATRDSAQHLQDMVRSLMTSPIYHDAESASSVPVSIPSPNPLAEQP